MNSTRLLTIEHLNKTYHTASEDVHALKDINLTFEQGELTSISGPSGSGKTTLLNLIGCLDMATDGKILLEGKDLVAMNQKERNMVRRQHLGFIFQNYNLIPVLKAWKNVAMALQVLDTKQRQALALENKEDIKEKCFQMLEKVGLKGMEERLSNDLSGGQQQRVSIARALVKSPSLILADEPTANLDSANGLMILTLIEDLNKSMGITCIYSSHDDLVLEHTRRVIILKDGQLQCSK